MLRQIEELVARFGLPCANVFHAGDGNLHPLILFDANVPGDKRAHRSSSATAILQLCIEVGGTITGEHGVGIEKIGGMCAQFPPAVLERFLGIKRAFDAACAAESRQGRPDARALRRVRPHARASRRAARIPDLPRF